MPATILDLCVHIYVYMNMQVMFCENRVHVSFCVMLYYSLGSKSTKPEKATRSSGLELSC